MTFTLQFVDNAALLFLTGESKAFYAVFLEDAKGVGVTMLTQARQWGSGSDAPPSSGYDELRFAAAQEVKAQKHAKKALRGSGHIAGGAAQLLFDSPVGCELRRRRRAILLLFHARRTSRRRVQERWIRAPPFYCYDSLGGTSAKREVRAAAFSLRRSRLVCK